MNEGFGNNVDDALPLIKPAFELACRIAGMMLAMVQFGLVLEHDFVQVVPFMWSLQRII